MDPSYNNSFGNGGPNVPASFNNSSTTGGSIVLANDGKKNTSRRIIIAVIIFFILLILVVLGFLFLRNKKDIKNDDLLYDNYNLFVNYVFSGEDSNGAVSREQILLSNPYYYKLSNNELKDYLDKTKEKYSALVEAYDVDNRDNDLKSIEEYFYTLLRVTPISTDELLEYYKKDGIDETLKIIDDRFSYDDISGALAMYVERSRLLTLLRMDLLTDADSAGCIVNEELISGCYLMTQEQIVEEESYYDELNILTDEIESSARSTLVDLYDTIYGKES